MWNPGWRALEAQRTRLNELADQAETTADLLEIESQLSDVQYQLENYTRQLRNMDQQVSYSTVDIYLEEVATLTPTGRDLHRAHCRCVRRRLGRLRWVCAGAGHCAGLPVAGGADRHCSHCGSAILGASAIRKPPKRPSPSRPRRQRSMR